MIEIMSGKEFMNQEIDIIPYLIEPILPAVGTVLFHGSPGVGKSTTTWQMAQCIQSGRSFLELPTTKGKALFVSLDMPKFTLYERWREGKYTPLFDICLTEPFDCMAMGFKNSNVYKALRERYDDYDYDLIIVDALAQTFKGSIIDDQIPKVVYAFFAEWFPDSCRLFIHHDRKHGRLDDGRIAPPNSEDFIGSQFWKAFAQSVLHLYHLNKQITRLEMTKAQQKPMDDPLDLYMDESGTKMQLYSEVRQRQESEMFIQAELQLKEQYGDKWDKMLSKNKIKLMSELLHKSTPTVYRWMKSSKLQRGIETLEGVLDDE